MLETNKQSLQLGLLLSPWVSTYLQWQLPDRCSDVTQQPWAVPTVDLHVEAVDALLHNHAHSWGRVGQHLNAAR